MWGRTHAGARSPRPGSGLPPLIVRRRALLRSYRAFDWQYAPGPQSYRIAWEEILGPVLSVLTFRTQDVAVAKANNTAYRLSAGV